MRTAFYTFWAVIALAGCSTAPSYHQPVTEVTRAMQITHQQLQKIAPKADRQAKDAFLALYRTSPKARETLRLSPKGCTRKAARMGESCTAEMILPGSGLTLRAGNDLTQAVAMARQLALYTLWLKKIATADNCEATAKASDAAMAQGVKLYELAAHKKLPISPKAMAAPLRDAICLYLERRKLEALQEATRLADPAVQAAAVHLVQMLQARAFSSTTYLRKEITRLEGEMLPGAPPAKRDKAAAQYVKRVEELDRALKYTAGLSAIAEGMGPSHAALMTALHAKEPDFTDVYVAAQTLRQGMALLRQSFELEKK